MKARSFVCAVVVVAFAPALAMPLPELQGRWGLTKEFAESVPEACKDAHLEVSDSEIKSVSGSQVITAQYRASKKHDDFVMIVTDVRVDGGPNCQGFEPRHVREHYAKLQIWRQRNGNISVYAPKLLMEIERIE